MKMLSASPGFGAPLSEQESKDFLATGKLNVHLGTNDEKGHTNIHPVWYYYDLLIIRYTLKPQSSPRKLTTLEETRMFTFA